MESEIPEASDVRFVGDYRPTQFSFGGHRRGLEPKDYAWPPMGMGVESLARSAREGGDVKHGAVLFRSPRLACVRCHQEGPNGIRIGPDLSKPSKPGIEHVVESILDPSKVIHPDYRAIQVTMKDGEEFYGTLAGESDDALRVRVGALGYASITIPRADISKTEPLGVSIMPTGLADALKDRQELLDLVRYVSEIGRHENAPRTGVEPDIAHAGLIRAWGSTSLKRGRTTYERRCASCHGTVEHAGFERESRRFHRDPLGGGADPFSMYRALTHGFGRMEPQTWMVPRQKYDVIHYIRETFFRKHNPSQYVRIDERYLAGLPTGTRFGPAPTVSAPWNEMDYGPFLTAAISGHAKGNRAYKGIAIPLGDGGMLFDTLLLRWAEAWTGGFLNLKGAVFDRSHQTWPDVAGDEVWRNRRVPGWDRAASFEDPRTYPYEPLPRDWGRWRGLYLHGNRVILSYEIGGVGILESPGREGSTFTRTINLAGCDREMQIQVAYKPPENLAFGFRGPDGCTWVEQDGHLRLRIPRGTERVTLLIDSKGGTFKDGPTEDLRPLIRGGPPRWKAPVETDVRRPDGRVLRSITAPAEGTVVELGRDEGAEAESFGNAASLTRKPDGSIRTEGLIGRWDFEEGEKGIQPAGSTWAEGMQGRAISFSGKSGARLEVCIDFATSDLTVSVWVRTAEDGSILSQTLPNREWVHGGKSLFIRDGAPVFDIGWVGEVAADADIADGTWHHVALTWTTAGEVGLYVDGAPAGEGRLGNGNPPESGLVVQLGKTADNFPDHSPYFNGRMDRLHIYGTVLPPDQIAALAGPKGSTTAWKIVDGPGSLEVSKGVVRLRVPGGKRVRIASWTGPRNSLDRFLADRPETPFLVEELNAPTTNPWASWMRFGGFDFLDEDRAVLCTWNGDVWTVSGLKGDRLRWRRFATGLHQPLGVKVVRGQIFIAGRNQITRLHDLNNDGEADYYEAFSNDIMNTVHFHEPVMGLQTDDAGNLFTMKAARHGKKARHPHHGTLIKVSPDGARTEVLAGGFRAPNGLARGPEGEFYTSDQQGFWMPANRITRIMPGGFHGNGWGWVPEEIPRTYVPPLTWLHPKIDRSPAGFAWVKKGWGPLDDHLLSISYGEGKVFLVLQQKIGDLRQGAVTELPGLDFPTGVMRGRFHPDGTLYICGLFGWSGDKTRPGGFYRIRRTEARLHVPVGFAASREELTIRFSEPLDPASVHPSAFLVKAWNYRWSSNYGSPDLKLTGGEGRTRWKVKSATLSKDGRSVTLRIPKIAPAMQFDVQLEVVAADGKAIRTFVHGTIHGLAD